MNLKLLPILFATFLAAVSAFAQSAQENLLEKVELRFTLEGEPTPKDVGFDNPKSYWKLKYELYLTDFAELEKMGRCRTDDLGRGICLPVYNKKLDKTIKKNSALIKKGGFSKKSLSHQANREITVPVYLQPEFIEVFNLAVKIPAKNPTFVLFINAKASTKNSSKARFKKKYAIEGVKPLKFAGSNETKEYWNIKVLSLSLTITKDENGRLYGFNGFIH